MLIIKIKCKVFTLIIVAITLCCCSCTNKQAVSNEKNRQNLNTQGDIKALSESTVKGDNNGGESKGQNQRILCNFKLIDGTGAQTMENMLIFIKDDRIEKIIKDEGNPLPNGYEKIDLKGCTVLPGFINTHVHCFYSEQVLQKWLKSGVTTVRELASIKDSDFATARRKSNQNPLNARIVTATPIITAKGGYIPPFAEYVDTSEEAVQITQKFLTMNPDVIKIAIEDDLQGNKWNMLSLELIKSVTKTAHEGNKKVSAHLSHVRNLRLAIDGGVDELAHMVVEPIDGDLAKKIADEGIYWVPTLELWQRVSKAHELNWDQIAKQNLSLFYKAGGKIALGTDYGGYSAQFDKGMPMTEIQGMKAAGMSSMDIIISATQNAAYVCGMEDELGTLEEGKIADLIVTKENPLEDLEALSDLYMVIHNGNIITKKE